MEDLNNRICLYCNKTLRKIGRDRKTCHQHFYDWQTRKYHRKCFYIIKNI